MAYATRADLEEAVASHLARSDLTAEIPGLISLATAFLTTEPRLRVREAEETVSLVPVANVCTLPTDYGAYREVWAETSPVRELKHAEPDYVREAYAGNVSSGYPSFFTVVGTDLTAYPLATSNISMIYYKKVEDLASSGDTNWLLAAFPHIYLYATLIQTAPFTGNKDRLGVWGQMLDTGLDLILRNDKLARFAKPVARVRGVTP